MTFNTIEVGVFRDEAKQKDITKVFTAWDGLFSTGLATVKDDPDMVATVVTISDTLWKGKIPYGRFYYFSSTFYLVSHIIFIQMLHHAFF